MVKVPSEIATNGKLSPIKSTWASDYKKVTLVFSVTMSKDTMRGGYTVSEVVGLSSYQW